MSASVGSKRIAIRCDASATMGGGHAMRCLTLANAFADSGANVRFVTASMPSALEKRITSWGHEILRIPASPQIQGGGSGWEQHTLGSAEQQADATATGRAIGWVDWMIVDHYLLDASWHSKARAYADHILVIDDLANRSYDCNILLDQTFGKSEDDYRGLVPGKATVLAGSSYALLRSEFERERPCAITRRSEGQNPRRILVSMGTTDPGGITARVTEQLIAAPAQWMIDVVLGAQSDSLDDIQRLAEHQSRIAIHLDSNVMAKLMRDADLAVGAGGMSALERCCLGLPSVILCLAENQRTNAMSLANAGAALFATNPAQAVSQLIELSFDGDQRGKVQKAAFQITDGLGAQRVVNVCDRCNSGKGA